MKVKYRLAVWETTVIFQVLDMDERFRCSDLKYPNIQVTGGLDVMSVGYPKLTKNIAYLWGYTKSYDHNISDIKFETSEEAQQYAKKVHYALWHWAKNWFNEEPVADHDPDIYTI